MEAKEDSPQRRKDTEDDLVYDHFRTAPRTLFAERRQQMGRRAPNEDGYWHAGPVSKAPSPQANKKESAAAPEANCAQCECTESIGRY